MKTLYAPNSNRLVSNVVISILAIGITTIPMWLVGRDTLGEAVIALVYLLPVAWSAYRFGQLPGIIAAVTAALTFDFLFIPPFNTFVIGSLEGWLVLAIFLVVAVVVVGRIQASITRASEATFMYELSSALAGVRTQEAAALTLARQIQQLFQASLVRVTYRLNDPNSSMVASQPEGAKRDDTPDRVLPILNSWGLVGEIQIWRGAFGDLPPADGVLFQNFTSQAARAFERTQDMETHAMTRG